MNLISGQFEQAVKLSNFAAYLKREHLETLASENMQLVNKSGMAGHTWFNGGISESEVLQLSRDSFEKFLTSLEEGNATEIALSILQQLNSQSLLVKPAQQINPVDLFRFYTAQKQAMINLIPQFTTELNEGLQIINGLEAHYSTIYQEAIRLLNEPSDGNILPADSETPEMFKVLDIENSQLIKIFTGLPDSIIITDLLGNIKNWTGKAEKIFGYSRQEASEQPLNFMYRPEIKESLTEKIISEIEKTGSFMGAIPCLKKDGSEILIETFSKPLFNKEGNPIYLISIGRDITEQQKTKVALAKSNEELKYFAYVASHDLQEPLRMVTSFMQLLAKRYKDKLDSTADEYISYACDGANRMQTMINDLLDYSRIDRKPLLLTQVNCEKILKKALSILQPEIEDTGAIISYENLPSLNADSNLIIKLFYHLIGNAIKYRSAAPLHITIKAGPFLAQSSGEADFNKRLGKTNEKWLFSIHDNGIGIDSQFFERIFMPFQRLHNRSDFSGNGIGLAICKKIVNHHDGDIWLESEPGKGSTFYFTISDKEE